MIKAYIEIALSDGDSIKYVRDVVSDSNGVGERYYMYEGPGYQELGLSNASSYKISPLLNNNVYYFTVNIDGAGATEYSIKPGKNSYGYIVNALNKATKDDGASWKITRNGDIRCYSNSTTASTSIVLSAGTSGTDLFASLGSSLSESAVSGEQYADLISAGQIKSDYESLLTSINGATNTLSLLSFPESSGATTELIRKNNNESNGELGKLHISIPVGQVSQVKVIENEIIN